MSHVWFDAVRYGKVQLDVHRGCMGENQMQGELIEAVGRGGGLEEGIIKSVRKSNKM